MSKKSTNETTYHLAGWILFVICAFFFIASSIRNDDPITLIGSILFLIACFVFLIPLFGFGGTSDQSTRFWDKIAERYSKRPVADEAAYQKKLKITREYLRPDMELLEFGCGTGSTAIVHAPHVRHIQAIDISSNMIEIACGKARSGNIENVTFEKSTIDEYDAPDQSLDVVLGLSILHLVEDREAVIEKVYRLLKPGGIFVTSTACLGDTMKFFKLIAPIGQFFGFIPLLKVFTTRQLEESITGTGFTIDYQWQPGKTAAVFIIAKKPESE